MNPPTSFAQGEYARRKKTTRREKFLAQMEAVVPWARLVEVLAPHYPSGKRGHPPVGIERIDLSSKTKTGKKGLVVVERELEVKRRLESQGAVKAESVGEGFDVVKNHGMSSGVRGRDEGAEAFGFERGPKGLQGGVVVAVGFAAHAWGEVAEGKPVAKVGAGIWAATVAVGDEVGQRSAGAVMQGTVQSGERQVRVEAGVRAPADDAAAKGIPLRSATEPALRSGETGGVL